MQPPGARERHLRDVQEAGVSVPQFYAVPAGLGPLRGSIVRVALSKQGIVEVPLGSNRGPEVDKHLPDWVIKTPIAEPWCCFFCFKVAQEALGKFPLGRWHGSCSRAWSEALRQGVAVRNETGRLPYPGDAFLINGPDPVDPDDFRHIGLVMRVAADGSAINTLEGNCGQRVRYGTRSLVDGQIGGWIDFAPSERPSFERGLLPAPVVGAQATR
jgi:hypothetical protein